MSSLRFESVLKSVERKPLVTDETRKRSERFGIHVFNMQRMRENLTREAFTSVKAAVDKGSKIDRGIADQIAAAMKDWAISKGATHYT
ncbi:MAG: glutamine synthetase III, partial [Bacteroidia bacterium]|nr:glutamine synthetase III [Bacteroidia bacterium]